ncbi:hypothetical protein I6A60_18360 [Frankia sp. AgB1.9]|uniref:hypothetical protein n=1 Tax=unclassified Frankia TaxID=2632575 RepID=UPI001932143B|nr:MULTISPECIES: hypothetical protein [unclassified Frankia]MBL7493565.1 hypothetical protein [Frankia sp. AgW1.1]MBL7549826.1 hypothetical protein [Frankia sp. AgB1.9]MBL7622418.1 hypothetical protein [Frankia sp. AgB1.8]
MDMNFDWMPNYIDGALLTETYDSPALLDGSVWKAFGETIARVGDELNRADVPQAPVDKAAGYRHLLAMVGYGINQALTPSDPIAPTLGAYARTDIYKWGLDCPDCAYLNATIRGDLDYRVWGNVGTVGYLGFQVMGGLATYGNIRNDELETDAEGNFELWVGPTKREGNYLASTPETNTLVVRQFFGDWDNEQRARLNIELVSPVPADASADRLVATPARVAAQIERIGGWLEANIKFWHDIEAMGQANRRNAFDPATVKSDMGGAEENINGWGHFDLAPDEALIIEATPAQARYWSLHIGNFWWESLDYATRHTSLNFRQAVLDDDGVFRAVVAHRDPGVPNWLDTMGHTKGPLLFRWVVADHGPDAVTKVVPFDSIRDHLPETTGVVTPEERAATVERRRRGAQRRFAST